MGWYIHCVENTIVIPEEDRERVTAALRKAGKGEVFVEKEWSGKSSWEALDKNGRPRVYYHHKEWADYFWRKEIQNVFRKEKVTGIVKFTCYSGDQAGQIWWYEFTKGKCHQVIRRADHVKLWLSRNIAKE